MATLFLDEFNGAGNLDTHDPDVGDPYVIAFAEAGPLTDCVLDGLGAFPQNASGWDVGSTLASALGGEFVLEMKFTITDITAPGSGYLGSKTAIGVQLQESALITQPSGLNPGDVCANIGVRDGDPLGGAAASGAWYLGGSVDNGATSWTEAVVFIPTGSMQTLRMEASASGVVVRLDGIIIASDTIVADAGMDAFIVGAYTTVGICGKIDEASAATGLGLFWTSMVKTYEVDT